ncbi:MAG: 16S rRNA (guanine(527)-N(7))-methyltransferase RsmG [Betaproteobacteria bacterium]
MTAADVAAGARALGVELSAEQADQLAGYAGLLRRWNTVYNLTAIDSASDVLTHHLLDSLSIVPHFLKKLDNKDARVLDVGSGGGLPGIPLAIAFPSLRVTLLDKVGKKAAFLLQAKVELGLANVEVVHGRVEDYRPVQPFDAIVSRAFAALGDFVALTGHLLAPTGFWAAMKGPAADDERAGLPAAVRVSEDIPLTVPGLAAERRLLILERTP